MSDSRLNQHLGDYLLTELAVGHIDFHIRASRETREIFGGQREVVRFYIHPLGADGGTQQYFIVPDSSAGPHILFVDTLDQPWPAGDTGGEQQPQEQAGG